MSFVLTLAAIAGALIICLYALNLGPFKEFEIFKQGRRLPLPLSDKPNTKRGFGRRSR